MNFIFALFLLIFGLACSAGGVNLILKELTKAIWAAAQNDYVYATGRNYASPALLLSFGVTISAIGMIVLAVSFL